jgi:hypothetical protein
MIPLSHPQIVQICIAARLAYNAWPMREEFELINSEMSRTKAFEAWRHCEIGKITGGIQSLKLCTNEAHYLPLLAHFTAMRGEGGKALMMLLRHADADRITIYFKLIQALEERELAEGYAATICRCKFKRDLGDASAKQLWSIFFDIRKRRKPTRAAGEHYVKSKAGKLTSKPTGDNPF